MMNFKKGWLSTVVISLGLLSITSVLPASAQTNTKSGSYLVKGGTIVTIANTSSNGDNYVIAVSGGQGPCSNNLIIFPKSGVINTEVLSRGYQLALTAFTQKLKVDVFDYSGASCSNGGQIGFTPPQ